MMVILCGIDGTAPSRDAARAAAALAKRTEESLRLVYVQEVLVLSTPPIEGIPVPVTNTAALEADRSRMSAELERLAERLVADYRVDISTEIRLGIPDHELVRAADEQGVSLIVVASLGRRSGSMWRLGSVADRLSQSSPVPVLVVRDTRPIGRWEREAHPLRVVLALGSGRTSEAAARAVAALRRHGPIELVEVHAYDPLEMAQRLGLREAESTEARRMIENSLARDLAGRVGQWAGPGEARFVALPARGHVAEALAEFADAERADLVVLGAQGRGALQRRLLGSISYGVLPLVGTNVLVVPTPATAKESAARAPSVATRVKSVLVATDLTEFGNRALEHALGALPEGGRLVLFHARRPPVGVPDHWRVPYMQEEARMNRALAEAELKKLAAQIEGKLETVVEAVESEDPAQAILEAAERHGVDLLCLGTHGRGRLATALLGSVAREVARRSPRPVLLVPHRPG